MDLFALPLWAGPTGPQGRLPLDTAFQNAWNISEKFARLGNRDAGDARLEWLQTQLRIARDTDAGTCARFFVEDDAVKDWPATRCITIDVLGPPRRPPAGVSYMDGPALPVRFMDWRRDEPGLAQKLRQMMKRTEPTNESAVPLNRSVPIGAFPEELEYGMGVLRANAATLSPECRAAFDASDRSLGGLMQLSYLAVAKPPLAGELTPEAMAPPTLEPTCHAEGCDKPAPMRCGRCRGATYCSTECQKADWRARHKAHCSNPAAAPGDAGGGATAAPGGAGASSAAIAGGAGRASVLVPALNPDSVGLANISIDFTGRGVNRMRKAEVPLNVHKGEFIVKVQTANEAGAPLLVYDKGKTFVTTVRALTPEGLRLAAFSRTSGIFGGRKSYLRAQREGDNLRIFIDKHEPLQPW